MFVNSGEINKLNKKGIGIGNVFNLAELYTLATLAIFTVFALLLSGKIENSWTWAVYNILIAVIIYIVATIEIKAVLGKYFSLLRRLYTVLIVFFIYSQAQVYIRAINPGLSDELLINLDYSLFGANPTQYLSQFINPVLTEYFQFAYVTFFFLPVFHGVELYFTNRETEFDNLVGIIVSSFYFSYLMYFFMPAIGPRFTLHNYSSIGIEMPGVLLTDFFRNFVDSGGGIPPGAPNPEFFVNRDCMPSGHTWITLVNIYMAYKFASKTRWVYYILGGSLIFATIYLRYHYVVDVFAGMVFAIITILIEPKLRSFYNMYKLRKNMI